MSPLIYGKKRTEEMVAVAPHRCFVGSGEGLAGHHVASHLREEKNRGDGCRRTSSSSLLRRIWRRTRRSPSSFIVAAADLGEGR
nr:hypothetical protein Iba_scaffold12098CG0020 [Ipomoea batatas]